MFAQVMNGFVEQSKVYVEPALEFNRIAMTQLHRIGQKQLTMTNDYLRLGLEQLQKASQLKSVEDISALAEEPLKLSADVSRKMADDAQNWVALGQEMSNEWQQFVASRMAFFSAPPKPSKTK